MFVRTATAIDTGYWKTQNIRNTPNLYFQVHIDNVIR